MYWDMTIKWRMSVYVYISLWRIVGLHRVYAGSRFPINLSEGKSGWENYNLCSLSNILLRLPRISICFSGQSAPLGLPLIGVSRDPVHSQWDILMVSRLSILIQWSCCKFVLNGPEWTITWEFRMKNNLNRAEPTYRGKWVDLHEHSLMNSTPVTTYTHIVLLMLCKSLN